MNTAELDIPLFQFQRLSCSGILKKLQLAGRQDIAMDLGTANTLIYVRHRGIVLNEPSVIAVDQSGEIIATGSKARQMLGKTSNKIQCIRPLKDGVIRDLEMTSRMIENMLGRVLNRRLLFSPRLVIGVPSGITQVEKRSIVSAAVQCGIDRVSLVEESTAAALGADLPVNDVRGTMIVDIGGGTTEIAIISMGQTLYSRTIRVGGDMMDEAIQRCLKRYFNLNIGICEAERIKVLIGSALPPLRPRNLEAYGSSINTGMPSALKVNDRAIREAIEEPIQSIIDEIIIALEQMNPETVRDILADGIHITGGGSLLRDLPQRLQRETGIRFHAIGDPMSCVVRGAGKIVENFRGYRQFCIA